MGDIITTFAKIGDFYLEDEKRVKNKAYEYSIVRVYLLDIQSKVIEPSLTIPKEDMIITRFGVGANSGNLFPNIYFTNKDVNKDFNKFTKAICKANHNFLSYFNQEQIKNDSILQHLYAIENPIYGSLSNMSFATDRVLLNLKDYHYHLQMLHQTPQNFFDDKQKDIQALQEHKKEKGDKGKVTTYLALSYQGKPISAYYKSIYDTHLNTYTDTPLSGYDILDNQEGIGGDANLAFCSTNEMPTKMKSIKLKLLPLSFANAKKVKIGFDAMDKMLSHNFYGLKMAIMPTLLDNDGSVYGEILTILEDSQKGRISQVEESETNINEFLEDVAYREKELPVLNTILFYNKNNAAVDVLLQIDDVLPSYISHISDRMGKYNIKAFKNKDEKVGNDETIFMHNLFEDRLEIMNLLLSTIKLDRDILIHKFTELIYWGTMNKAYAHPIEWSKYFNGYYNGRSIEAIQRYVAFFNDTKKLKGKLILQKEIELMGSDKQEKIEQLLESSPFLDSEVLKSAYLLGMLSSALMSWQYGVSGNSSYEKWLNNSGMIGKDSLDRIWKKAEETIRKLTSTSGKSSPTVNAIKEVLIEYLSNALINKDVIKSSYVSLAFAMGGSDYSKHIKDKNTKKEEEK